MRADDHPPNVIAVHPNGGPISPETRSLMSPGAYGDLLERLIADLESQRPKKVLVFVHGGLNTLRAATRRARELTPEIRRSSIYPIFVVWKSGLISSYLEHLVHLRQGRFWRWAGIPCAVWFLVADVGRGLTRFPISVMNQLLTDLSTACPGLSPSRGNSEALYRLLRKRCRGGADALRVECGVDARTALQQLGRFALYWLTFASQLVAIPLIDAMGKSAWRSMLRRTKTMFRGWREFDVSAIRKGEAALSAALDSPATGAVSQFFQRLSEWTSSVAEPSELTLIGHSMGTVVLNEAMTKYPDLPYRNIVYLGAACSIRDFERSVVPLLERRPKLKFYNLCLHPVAEGREIQARYGDIPPRGTLLAWIDNMLADPETSADRVLGKWDNILQATHVIPASVRSQVTIKAFGVGGRGDPSKHGDFSQRAFWLREFWEAGVAADGCA